MLIVRANGKLLSLDGHIHKQPWPCSRLAFLAYAFTTVLVISLLFKWRVRAQLARRTAVWAVATNDSITRTPRAPLSWTAHSGPTSSLDGRVSSGQGQAPLGKRTNRGATSGGGASGTAPAGLGGSMERRRMEDEEKTVSGPRSRGVSTIVWSDGTETPAASPLPEPLFPADEDGDMVIQSASLLPTLGPRIAPGPVGSAEERQGSVDDPHFGGPSGARKTARPGSAQGAPARAATSPSVRYMADDEHIQYGGGGAPDSEHSLGRTPASYRRVRLSLNRAAPFLPPLVVDGAGSDYSSDPKPVFSRPESLKRADILGSNAGQSFNRGAERSSHTYTKCIPVPSAASEGRRLRNVDGRTMDENSHTSLGTDGLTSPSSYPSTSPLLPPPPPVAADDFDPAVIMFPGPGAADGGIRVVPPQGLGRGGPAHFHGDATAAFENAGDDWKRHTRVYGGGVCLACAGRGGGFYGARVRPEDRR